MRATGGTGGRSGPRFRFIPDKIVDVAERLACHTVLTGRETVHIGDDVPAGQLGLQDLSGRFDEDELRAVGSSGLCDPGAPETFRFAHRQFAEYLAGRRLARLPTHQSRAFLAGPDGWRSGAAGPLRETAAFAAMFATDLAAWLSNRDPEVVGLSDVADDALRQRATLGLLDRFRNGILEAGQLHRGGMELRGFQYEGAETDLRPVLQERGDCCEHVLMCAISLIRSWRLSSMSDALADFALDSMAPLHARTSAGHALLECGTDGARERLKPLVGGLPEDDQDELKGIALRCNWPDRLSTPELFDALTPRRQPSLLGAYCAFLHGLDAGGFPSPGQVAAGLRWATNLALEPSATEPLHRLGMRIAHAALRELEDPEIAGGLVSLMRHWMKWRKSPLAPWREDPLNPPLSDRASLYADRPVRRRLIDRLTEFAVSTEELQNLAFEVPGLLHEEDFQWLLRRGCDGGRAVAVRERYLEIAKFLPWRSRRGDVDAWLRVCDADPVKKVLGNQKSIALDSEQATRLREDRKRLQDRKRKTETPPLDPPPRERVLKFLALSETKDVGYFPNLCRELTLKPTSTRYEFGRFLTNTPGWRDADPETRKRIVEVAKRYLSVDAIAEDFSSKGSQDSIYIGAFEAMWLLLEVAPDWLKSRPDSWWNGWCRYILAKSMLNMHEEPTDPKLRLVTLLNGSTPSSVCREVMHLLSSDGTDGRHWRLSDALRLLADQPNTRLDEKLCEALEGGEVQEEDIVDVAEFVLRRVRGRSLPMCFRILENARIRSKGSQAEHVAVALLRNCPGASWTVLKTYLDADQDGARRVLEKFAYDNRHESFAMSTRQLGELADMLLDLFPPDEDDDDEDKGSLVEPVDAARLLRTRLISRLDRLCDEPSVDAFRRLEQRLGNRYPWLAGARIHAERGYRRTLWSPFPVGVIADVMDAKTRRLLRSDEDVVDGIECALDQYAEALRQDGTESVEDLWNTAGTEPSPKAEEHVSRKLCGVVRSYFENAVAAAREVKIFQRSVGRADGGQPGSEVDILVQAPGRGTTSGDAIRVPIEVKLSSNPQAKTGMKDQLVDRYMRQLGATHGVHVVVWMTTPNPKCLQRHHRPRWSCIEDARRDLEEKAKRLSEERQVRVRAVVVDGSLR